MHTQCQENTTMCLLCFWFCIQKSLAWKGKMERGIRDKSNDKPGGGTSCDHITSTQPGLIPQNKGTLTHERFWGSVLYADHFSDFIYNHLISGTTSLETLQSKHAYERIAKSYGIQVKSHRADNIRFDDLNFKGDFLKGGVRTLPIVELVLITRMLLLGQRSRKYHMVLETSFFMQCVNGLP